MMRYSGACLILLCFASAVHMCLVCRKEWEELSAKKHSFKVGTQVGEIQDRAMRRAVSLHDTLLGIPHEKAEAARKRKLGEVISLRKFSSMCYVQFASSHFSVRPSQRKLKQLLRPC